jgi:hypothetical protein
MTSHWLPTETLSLLQIQRVAPLPIRDTFSLTVHLDRPMSMLLRLETRSPLADALLLTRPNLPPTMKEYDMLDTASWTSRSNVHTLAGVVGQGDYVVRCVSAAAVGDSRWILLPRAHQITARLLGHRLVLRYDIVSFLSLRVLRRCVGVCL